MGMTEPNDDLLHNLMQTFRAEASDHLDTLNQTLLQIERVPEEAVYRTLVQDAFRAAHSLKGAARAVSLTVIEQLAHAMEHVLQTARDTGQPLDADTCDVLYDVLDAIRDLLDGGERNLRSVQARLDSIGAGDLLELPDPPEEEATEEEATEGAQQQDEAPTSTAEETIRVAVSKLDNLMVQTGELLVAKISAEQQLADTRDVHRQLARWPRMWNEIKSLLPRINGEAGQQLSEALTRHHEQMQTIMDAFEVLEQSTSREVLRLDMVSSNLQDEVRRVRMVPFQNIALMLERAVRDVAHSEEKQVDFELVGSDVELDRKVLETLKDPLMHVVRNAVSHGIETPAERAAAGKPERGHLTLTVQQRGREVRIVVRDDGKGFDLDALRMASQRRGGPVLDDSASVEEILALALHPGMSTADEVTSVAGRGVGLDVVNKQLQAIQGMIAIENNPGQGASIEMVVPTSLILTRGLLVQVGQEQYVLPLLSVEKIIEPEAITTVGGKQMLTVDGGSLPLVSLAAVLDRPIGPSAKPLAVVIGVAEQRLALLVDDVLTEQELTVKPLSDPLRRVRNVTGAALLGNGQPVVILNPADLLNSAQGIDTHFTLPDEEETEDTGPDAHILVVDDSITTRTLEKNILESAGYRVTIAVDGLEAFEQLEGHDIDLVISDVQMPNVDGIELTRQIREHETYGDVPIILVTSLEDRGDREKGLHAGADAYMVKRGFDQAQLLTTIQAFLE